MSLALAANEAISVPGPLLALAVAGSVLLALALLYPDRPIGVRSVPGVRVVPGTLPLIGNWRMMWEAVRGTARRGRLDLMLEQQRGVGAGGQPFAIHVIALGGRTTLLNRPEYLQWMQSGKGRFSNYVKGAPFRRNLADLLSDTGIFVADGDIWKRQRKLASHIFSVSNFRSHVQHTVQRELTPLLKLAEDAAQRGEEIALPDVFFRYTLETFGMMAFGAELGCLPSDVQGLAQQVPFAMAFDYAQTVVNDRFMDPLWPVTELFSQRGRRMRRALATIRATCFQIIDQRRANQVSGGAHGVQAKGGQDLLQLFLNEGLDREELLPVVLNFIIAGRDTTAQALTWCIYLLHSAPHVTARLREEVAQVLGEGPDQRLMEYDDLKALPYTQAVVHETLRLQPPVAKNLKFAVDDDVIRPYAQEKLAGGTPEDPYGTGAVRGAPLPDVVIQKGTTVSWSDYLMARMPEVWGPDCEEFKPERFLTLDGALKTFSPYVFHAFNAGPRLCLGQTLALYEACAVLSSLLGQYDVFLDDAALARTPPTYGESITLPMIDPYRVRLAKRQIS